MTDNEIIKALGQCETQETCSNCPYFEKMGCKKHLYQDALDLINRQKAEIEKQKKKVQARNAIIAEQKAENKDLTDLIVKYNGDFAKYEAEIERLEKENKLLIDNDVSNKYPNCVLVEKGRIYTKTLEDYDNLIGDISAEAVKEFAESLKERANEFKQVRLDGEWAISQYDIDKLLKEMVGEDNA